MWPYFIFVSMLHDYSDIWESVAMILFLLQMEPVLRYILSSRPI